VSNVVLLRTVFSTIPSACARDDPTGERWGAGALRPARGAQLEIAARGRPGIRGGRSSKWPSSTDDRQHESDAWAW